MLVLTRTATSASAPLYPHIVRFAGGLRTSCQYTRGKDDAYLEEDLNATAQELAGGNIEISDEQMQRMVAMYRHDEDSNVAMNDTLESVVCRVLGRN